LIAAAVVALAACRQADGQVPELNENVKEELVDVRRDLQNISNRDPTGAEDLGHDLRKYTEKAAAHPAIDELTRRAANVLPGKKVDQPSGDRLAEQLWMTVAARQLSERQLETLQNDLHSTLVSVGVDEANAQQVAAQVLEVQKQIGERQRRWYEWF
jgi:hypothetical protein